MSSASRPRAGRRRAVVLDAETRQALTTTRSLGRAGWVVDTTVTPGAAHRALASGSRWCNDAALMPPLVGDGSAFADGLLERLDARPTDVLLPMYDGSISAVRTRRSEIEKRTALALADEGALDVAADKGLTLELARRLGITIPRRASTTDGIEAAIDHVGLPAVLKPYRSWENGARRTSLVATSLDEARRVMDEFAECGVDVDVQQWLSGRRDAVTVLSDGDIKVCFAQTSHRELPRLGGVSVLCESIEPLDDIIKPAQALVLEMGLMGCSLVEFRRDARGAPVLMEINPRIPGSVALAVGCGIDLPLLTSRWALGDALEPVRDYAVGRQMRWLVGDVWSLYSAFHGDHGPDVPTRSRAVLDFARDFARLHLRATFELGDPRPAWVEARANLLDPIRDRVHRAVRPSPTIEARTW